MSQCERNIALYVLTPQYMRKLADLKPALDYEKSTFFRLLRRSYIREKLNTVVNLY